MKSNPFKITVEAEGTSIEVQVTWPHRSPKAAMDEMIKVAAALDDVDEQTYASQDDL